MTFLNAFKTTIETTMTNVERNINKNIDEKIADVNAGMEKLTHNSRRMEEKQNQVNLNLEERLSRMETNMQRMQHQRMWSKTVGRSKGNNEEVATPKFKLAAKDKPTSSSPSPSPPPPSRTIQNRDDEVQEERLVRQMSWADEVEEVVNRKETENDDLEDEVRKRLKGNDRAQWVKKRRSSWAESLEDDLKNDGDKAQYSQRSARVIKDRHEKKEDTKHKTCKNEMKSVDHWFGDCVSDTDDSSEEDEEDVTEDWERVERKKRNQLKRRRAALKKQKKKEEIAGKAQRMVGLGPIYDKDISKHIADTKDYNEAKIWAIKEHLAINYKYNQEELDNICIAETKRSSKGDNIIYLAMTSKSDIRDIYARKAECRADSTTVKNFIPPQFYEKFMALNKLCAGRRAEDPLLKTQIRFTEADLEVLVKVKGGEAPYKAVNLKDFAAGGHIPSFDASIKWKWQEDRLPRRRVKSRDLSPRSNAITDKQAGYSLTRLHSGAENSDLPPKKLRRQANDATAAEPEAEPMNTADITL